MRGQLRPRTGRAELSRGIGGKWSLCSPSVVLGSCRNSPAPIRYPHAFVSSDRPKDFPDLVLEIALTSGGVKKLEVYRRFKVPEVWFWRRNKLDIFGLDSSGNYDELRRSRLLSGLDIALIERCVATNSWQQARQAFRAALSKAK